MARKTQIEQIDEEQLLLIASRMSSSSPMQSPAPAPVVAAHDPEPPAHITSPERYRLRFLVPCTVQRRVAVYVSEQVRDHIASVVGALGGEAQLSSAGYIENVLRQHLDTYRDDINALYRSLKPTQKLL